MIKRNLHSFVQRHECGAVTPHNSLIYNNQSVVLQRHTKTIVNKHTV